MRETGISQENEVIQANDSLKLPEEDEKMEAIDEDDEEMCGEPSKRLRKENSF